MIEAGFYLLLNSDTRVEPGAISILLKAMAAHPEVGLIDPRLQEPSGEAQVSCFRYRSPMSEFLAAARTGSLSKLFKRFEVPLPVSDVPIEPQWISFACVLIRRQVIDQIGPLDEGYFMYTEDVDYCRRTRQSGWRILYEPRAKVTHLQSGSSSLKSAIYARQRLPRYYYASRSRYFGKFYGGSVGLCLTNLLWITGRLISLMREVLGTKQPHLCANTARDIWTNWLHPMHTDAP
jgi:N-acetylglucosaminyl-diphospho-decaprenol L-rhamnosyltransferase